MNIFTREFSIRVIIEVILLGIVVFFVQNHFQNKWQPLTAAETLKKENFLNAKRDVYFQAIELANRAVGNSDLYEPGKNKIDRPRNIGSKYPTEIEVNSCFSKLCIYSDDKEIILLFKEIFLPINTTRPIAVLEDLINLMRKDLGYGKGIISLETNEYQYIQIGARDSI